MEGGRKGGRCSEAAALFATKRPDREWRRFGSCGIGTVPDELPPRSPSSPPASSHPSHRRKRRPGGPAPTGEPAQAKTAAAGAPPAAPRRLPACRWVGHPAKNVPSRYLDGRYIRTDMTDGIRVMMSRWLREAWSISIAGKARHRGSSSDYDSDICSP